MNRYVAMIRTDVDDRHLTESAITEVGTDIPIRFINETQELEMLVQSEGEPSLILLNDNRAGHNGYEDIAQLKENPLYRHIPVILLGEQSTAEYIRKCYRAGANSVIIKPATISETNKKIGDFFNYWFNVAAV